MKKVISGLVICAVLLAGCMGEPSSTDRTELENETIRVKAPRLDNLENVFLPQALPDGSLYYIETNQDNEGQVMYLAPGSNRPSVYAVSQYPDGGISELFASQQWVAWVDSNRAMEWSLYVQDRSTGTIQKVASSDDEGAAKKGVDPLQPRIDDGKLVFIEPGPDSTTNIVGIDLTTGERMRFTTSGLASLPSISSDHILYGEVYTDERPGGIWWLTSWENETREKLFDALVSPPKLVYPMIAVYMKEGDRRLRLENLETREHTDIEIPGDYDLVYDLSQDYLVWHVTTEQTFSALNLADGTTYTIVGPSDYHILRPQLSGKTLLFEGYNQSGKWALFTVELP